MLDIELEAVDTGLGMFDPGHFAAEYLLIFQMFVLNSRISK